MGRGEGDMKTGREGGRKNNMGRERGGCGRMRWREGDMKGDGRNDMERRIWGGGRRRGRKGSRGRGRGGTVGIYKRAIAKS